MARVNELNGLMAAPTVSRGGGFTMTNPNLDFSEQKNLVNSTSKLSGAMLTAYEDLQEAKVIDFTNQYKIAVNEKLYGKNGSMLEKGANVVRGVNGQTFTERNVAMLDDTANKIADDLGLSGAEREAALKRIDNTRTSYVLAIQAHEGEQNRQYIKSTNESAKAASQMDIQLGGDMKQARDSIYASNVRLARNNGLDVNSKDNRSLLELTTQKEVSESVVNRVTIQLANDNVDGATESLALALDAGYLTATDAVKVREMVDTARFNRKVEVASDGVSKHMAMGFTPANIVVSAAGLGGASAKELAKVSGINDPVLMELPDGDGKALLVDRVLKESGGDVRMALATLMLGGGEVKAAVSRAIEVNASEGRTVSWFDLLSDDKKNQIDSAYKKYITDTRTMASPSVEEVERNVRAMYPHEDKAFVDATVKKVQEAMADMDAERKAKQAVAVDKTFNNIQSSGVMTLDAETSLTLTPSQHEAARVYADKVQRGEDFSNATVLVDLQNNPNKLKNMSDADWLSQKAYLSTATWKDLDLQRRSLLGEKDVKLDVSYSEINHAVDVVLNNMSVELPSDKEDRNAYLTMYRDAVTQEVRRLSAQKGGALSQTDYAQVAESVLGGIMTTKPGFWSDSKDLRFAEFRASDLTSKAKNVAKVLSGSEDPSDAMLVYSVQRFMSGVQPYVPSSVMQLPAVRTFKEDFERVNKVSLDDATVLRLFFINEHGDKYTKKDIGLQFGVQDRQQPVAYDNGTY